MPRNDTGVGIPLPDRHGSDTEPAATQGTNSEQHPGAEGSLPAFNPAVAAGFRKNPPTERGGTIRELHLPNFPV